MADTRRPTTINLVNSQRSVNKATYAPAALPQGAAPPAQILEKAAFARSLAISQAEVAALEALSTPEASSTSRASRTSSSRSAQQLFNNKTLRLMAEVARTPWPDALRRFGSALAQTPREELAAVGQVLVELRQANTYGATEPAPPAGRSSKRAAPATQQPPPGPAITAVARQTALAVNTFKYLLPLQPVGALHLERLEMTPVGVEHGELVHSVPMTPGESVNISHREWTVTTQTFETIVHDSFEGFSETGVTDKTDLSQATESETKHSTSLDINGSVTASYNGGPYSVTASAATDYSNKDESRNSIKDSIAHSVAITRNASARTRKEHKNSFRVSSVAGTEDLAVRTLTNKTDHAIRVDYFQLIRKWRIDLIRYGLRLTYDLVIPNPGIDLIGLVKELEELEGWLSTATFTFDQPLDEIQPTTDSWLKLQTKYNIALDPPPDPTATVNFATAVGPKGGNVFDFYGLDVPENYALSSGSLQATIHGGDNLWLIVEGRAATVPSGGDKHNLALSPPLDLGSLFPGARGHISIMWGGGDFDSLQFMGSFAASVLPEVQAAWRAKTYLALHDAAQEHFNQTLQRGKDRKTYLEDLIGRFDALTLRKMEHEEVMKWVLNWLLLGGLPLQSSPVSTLAKDWDLPDPGAPPPTKPDASPSGLPVPTRPVEGIDPAVLDSAATQQQVLEYGEFVKFIHNAIEWENVLYLAYPYFWDAYQNWPFKRFLLHPDPVHREFLRAGAARVVLTIRPGYEDAFMQLVTGGPTTDTNPIQAVYVSIGQEVHNQDLTNYQNIPPANPDRTARPLLYALQQSAWADMQSIIGGLEEFRNQKNHYPPGPETGLPGVLKAFLTSQPQIVPGTGPGTTNPAVPTFAGMLWNHLQTVPVAPGGNFDDPKATFIDPWGNPYHYTTPSPTTPVLHGDYELVCYGSDNAPGSTSDPLSQDITSWADGLLVGQWYEYTPTSALDVSVDTTLSIDGPPLAG